MRRGPRWSAPRGVSVSPLLVPLLRQIGSRSWLGLGFLAGWRVAEHQPEWLAAYIGAVGATGVLGGWLLLAPRVGPVRPAALRRRNARVVARRGIVRPSR